MSDFLDDEDDFDMVTEADPSVHEDRKKWLTIQVELITNEKLEAMSRMLLILLINYFRNGDKSGFSNSTLEKWLVCTPGELQRAIQQLRFEGYLKLENGKFLVSDQPVYLAWSEQGENE